MDKETFIRRKYEPLEIMKALKLDCETEEFYNVCLDFNGSVEIKTKVKE